MHASPVSLTPVVHSLQVYGTGTTPELKKNHQIFQKTWNLFLACRRRPGENVL
jgi:hypothetical protein